MARAQPEVTDPLVANFYFLPDPSSYFKTLAPPIRQAAEAFDANVRNMKSALKLLMHTVIDLVGRSNKNYMKVNAMFFRGTAYDDPKIATEIEVAMRTPLFVQKLTDTTLLYINELLALPAVREGLRSNLHSATSSAWTAIECLSGDLWEVLVNEFPGAMPEQALRKQGSDGSGDGGIANGISDKGIAFWQLRKANFDLRKCMGTLLRGKFDFTSVDGIERAYSPILHNEAGALLKFAPLALLEATRHVLVHRGGVVDDDYARRWKKITGQSSMVAVGSSVPLDSSIVSAFVNTATRTGVRLVLAANRWVKTH